MIDLQNYLAKETLHEGTRTVIYRGARKSDGLPVILKTLRQEYPEPAALARLRHEFEIARELQFDGVVKFIELVEHHNSLVLVEEDFGGESLQAVLQAHKLDLDTVLALASQLAETLGRLHQCGVMHKDINPSNLVVNLVQHKIQLIDFGIASRLPKEHASLHSHFEGTLAYMSPEQTGRMNRGLDYRTDFYSLGVTFYEMLTGRLPFPTSDAMELVHSHIAKTPPAPHALEARIPPALSEIVMKLLAKTAEGRYQSGFGLQADLEECRRQWQRAGRIEMFPPGQNDFSERFHIPEKLYGREADIKTLLEVFDRVMQGRREMMLVTGDPGIGKSALVHEVQKSLVRSRGHFVAGKFDQYQRNIPYASLIHAFQDLVRQILTESEASLRYWRECIQSAVGVNGRVIAEVIPEIELIIGKQAPVPELGPTEAQNRFNLVFQNFVAALPAQEHPLVIFLDDLQWADLPSLKLLQYLITGTASPYFLGLGAYRDSEVGPGHPLMLTINEIEKAGVTFHRLALQPLGLEHVEQLLADTLQYNVAHSLDVAQASSPADKMSALRELAELILEKTAGNPFFLNQFLASLHEEKLLLPDPARRAWQWDIAKIRERNITDNVVELMTAKLKKLPLPTQQQLVLAACLGNEFEATTLAIIAEKSPEVVARDLTEALAHGLVLLLGKERAAMGSDDLAAGKNGTLKFRFSHDRIQQAAYSLLSETERAEVHWRIGQLLLQNTPPEKREQKIFDLAAQLNLGRSMLGSKAERIELAQLNLQAGHKAKLSTAYEPARVFLQTGLELLRDGDWNAHYELALDLHVEAAEAACLCGDFAAMEKLATVVEQRAHTLLDRARVVIVKLQALITQNQLPEVITTALPVMRQLGLHYPDKPSKLHVIIELLKTKWAFAGKNIERLDELPAMTDAQMMTALQMSTRVGMAAYFEDPNLLAITALKPVRIFLRRGNAPISPLLYTSYGIVLCGVIGDIEAGYRFGKLGLRLAEKFPAAEFKSRHLFVHDCLIRHWKEPVRDTLDSFLEAYKYGLEVGDLEYAGLAILQHLLSSFLAGVELTKLEAEREKYDHAITTLRNRTYIHVKNLCQQQILNFMGKSEDPLRLVGEVYNEEVSLPEHLKENDHYALYDYYYDRIFLDYLFENYGRALEDAQLAVKYLDAVGTLALTFVTFYETLAALAHEAATPEERKRLRRLVQVNKKKLKKWAKHAPANHLHKYELVEAELARVRSSAGFQPASQQNADRMSALQQAMRLYDQAIAHAQESRHLREEALANELAAKFYLSRGQEKIAKTYLREAHYLYHKWGAFAKVQQLERKYGELLQERGSVTGFETATTLTRTSTSTGTSSGALDVLSVLKATQAISGEIDLEKLLAKMIKIVIENAGAQRGCFLIESENGWLIEAEGFADQSEPRVLQSQPLAGTVADGIVHYVSRTREAVVLGDAAHDGRFTGETYVQRCGTRSLLCKPVIKQNDLIGILYLENDLATNVFVPSRLEAVEILASQIAVSLENARLYKRLEQYNRTLEEKVQQRTAELQDKNAELTQTLQRLREMQNQLVTQEKLASLGQLTAGIAHEIKNPLNFVNNFAVLSVELAKELREELGKQRAEGRGHGAGGEDDFANIEEIIETLIQNAEKINHHGKRADGIVKSMMQHARGSSGQRELVDINQLLDEAVNLTYHGMRANDASFNITIEKDYDASISNLEVVPQDLSRVFLNLINNACYAAHQKALAEGKAKGEGRRERGAPIALHPSPFAPTLSVSTKNFGDQIEIRIRDNGNGIPPEIREKIFNPFFTTKPAGQGTGLGLSISHEIVVQQHKGEIKVETEEGKFTEFVVRLPRSA
ncbi:MAG: AAA family ATPase [candidate division KSB1 bacterium]|nr:AAA family ATPase [candidate division KSB1 bacterium]MDZ7273035.1 AAA family ATPase [candidate division KSB1 bacterium]MDZ7285138.1 AAA family ATPase [candidate division KSB1 bacterium]MDZ7298170.1 AAA family ATPase [candidate division KSB1 bacterium]MDZ7306924.1 AAA family ATPase [candidate division KSB1 bacterium]